MFSSPISDNTTVARNLLLNLCLYPWYLALTFESFSSAVWYLYLFSYKGLSLGEMAWLTLLGDGLIVLAEVPTGWLADRLGRRLSMLMGILAQAASAALFIFGHDFATFWLAMAVCGLGDTLRGGADEALLYDSCVASRSESRYAASLGHAVFVASVVGAAAMILGGWIATVLSWELPFWIEIGFSALGFITVWRMVEPPRAGSTRSASSAITARPPRRPIWAAVAPVAVFATLVSVVPELAHFHLPAELNTTAGFTPLHLGLLFAVLELTQGWGSKYASRLTQRTFGTWFAVLAGISAVAYAAIAARSVLPAVFGIALYLLARAAIDFSAGVLAPLISLETNRRTPNNIRATSLSVVRAGQRLLPLGLLPLSASLILSRGYALGHLAVVLALLPLLALAVLWLVRTSSAGNCSHTTAGEDRELQGL